MSTIDPAGGATDSVLRFPNMNLDYNAGEKLVGLWIGKITPEGAAVEFMGDGGFSTTYPGWGIRVSTLGKAQLKLADATTTYFGGTSTSTVFDGNLHSLGFTINGQDRNACLYVDEVLDATYAGGPLALNSGNPIDTRNANTVNLGTTLPNSAASTVGIATQTRCLVLLRLPANVAMPSTGVMTTLFKQIRSNPGKLITRGAF